MSPTTFTLLRKILNLPQRKLARIFAVTPTTIHNWENAKSPIPQSVAIALSLLCEKKVKDGWDVHLNWEKIANHAAFKSVAEVNEMLMLETVRVSAAVEDESKIEAVTPTCASHIERKALLAQCERELFSLLFHKFYIVWKNSGILQRPSDELLAHNLEVSVTTLARWKSGFGESVINEFDSSSMMELITKMVEILRSLGEWENERVEREESMVQSLMVVEVDNADDLIAAESKNVHEYGSSLDVPIPIPTNNLIESFHSGDNVEFLLELEKELGTPLIEVEKKLEKEIEDMFCVGDSESNDNK